MTLTLALQPIVSAADRATQCAVRLLKTLPERLNLFINVHPGELADAEAVRFRYEQLRPWVRRVVFEITERSYVLENETWR
jgi:EAL domain-containing protein (putative c-di-GMP-specific phosphodiesterase class I)